MFATSSKSSPRRDALSILCRGSTSVRTYRTCVQRSSTGGTGPDDSELAFTDRHFVPLFPKGSKDGAKENEVRTIIKPRR